MDKSGVRSQEILTAHFRLAAFPSATRGAAGPTGPGRALGEHWDLLVLPSPVLPAPAAKPGKKRQVFFYFFG